MKSILVLTDFTIDATRAAKSGLHLAEKLNKDIILYHSIIRMPVIPNYAPGPWAYDESTVLLEETQQKLQSLADYLRKLEADLPPNAYKPIISMQGSEGNLGENARELLDKGEIDFVVMGGRSGDTIHHLLNGSETLAVIRHATRPVLIIPGKSGLKTIKKIVFATDYKTSDIASLVYLSSLAAKLDFALEVVHIRPTGDTEIHRLEQEKAFVDFLEQLGHPNLTYKVVHGMNVVNRLHHYCEASGADILALVHEQPGVIASWVRHSDTKEAMSKNSMPLFVFPQHMLAD